MEGRRRIVKEIRRNAALLFGCDAAAVSIAFDRVEGDAEAWRAVACGPSDARLGAAGKDANAALVALLDLVIDRANGEPIAAPIMSPELEKALRLLQMKRRDLIEAIRAELDGDGQPDEKS